MQTSRSFRSAVALVAIVVAGCSSSGAGGSVSESAGAPPATLRPVVFGSKVGDVTCDLGGHDEAYHVHVRFRFTENGAPADPDSNIGVDETRCMYWVHTHDATGGVVHVEAPNDVTVTLGDFLDVWGATFPSSPKLAAALAGLQAGKLTIGGEPAPADWRSIPLADKLDLLVGP